MSKSRGFRQGFSRFISLEIKNAEGQRKQGRLLVAGSSLSKNPEGRGKQGRLLVAGSSLSKNPERRGKQERLLVIGSSLTLAYSFYPSFSDENQD